MKKNGDTYGDFEGLIYPFLSCLSMNSLSESSSPLAMGYTLQSKAFGVSGKSSIAWSHGLGGGKRCDSFSLNVRVCRRYSSGTICSKVLLVLSMAFWASSDAVVVLRIMVYGSPSLFPVRSSHSSSAMVVAT